MRVVIAGGHGKIALLLERLLAERGDQAVGLIRNPAHVADVRRAGAEAVEAVSSRLHRRPVVYAAGGWTRSPGWISIKQSVTDIRLRVIAEPEVTAVGAALLAASAIGWDTAVASALI